MPRKPKATTWPVFDLTQYDVDPNGPPTAACQSHVMSGMHCNRPVVAGQTLCASHLAMAGDLIPTPVEVTAET
jgi:hypothetical protein